MNIQAIELIEFSCLKEKLLMRFARFISALVLMGVATTPFLPRIAYAELSITVDKEIGRAHV